MERVSVFALGFALTSSLVNAGPCDIYDAGGTPCIAAHSTTRALYDDYTDALYQISRGSDNATVDIAPLSAGGVANATVQDLFCASTTCLITIIYDQSGSGNHLTQAPEGAEATGPDANGNDYLSSATGAPVTLNGTKAYGVFLPPATGYRNNAVNGSATGDEAEGIYAVVDGTHYNGHCCFDYGNAEVHSDDTGGGHMEAIYFGDDVRSGTGAGSGPWVMADLEDGLFSGPDLDGNNPTDLSTPYRFVTAIVKGDSGNQWAIRGGDATSGSLTTMYSGARPSAPGYNPMSKEGSIVLGVGGDNSDWGQGTFYEGVMTTGYPSDETENAVQANIVAAGYAATSLTSGPKLTVNSSISLRVTTAAYDTRYIAHTSDTVNTQVVSSSSSASLKQQASWTVRTGLGNSGCFSFESNDTPGSFIRHSSDQLKVDANDGTKLFGEDATFCPQAGLNGQGNSLRSWSYPTRYWRHYTGLGYIASNGGPHNFDNPNLFNDDVSFVISDGFA